MGISATDFWNTSKNGKAMVVMLARRGDVELCREVCEWLVYERRKNIEREAQAGGRNPEQAKSIAMDAISGLQRAAEAIDDRNCEGQTSGVIDAIFARHYAAGKSVYDKAMADFADMLRNKIRD
jgi:hypothetical protein